MAYGTFLRSQRTGLVVVVDEVRHRGVLTTISRAVYPVVDHVVDEVEDTTPADAWVTTRIVGPQVAHEGRVLTADGRAEGVVPRVECLGRDSVLDSNVHGRLLALGLAIVQVEHVAIERDVLVESPLARAMVNHDVAHGVATERVLAVGHLRLAATEAHVAHDDVVRIHLERLASNDDAVAGSRLSGYSNIRSAHVDGRLQTDDTADVEHHDAGTTLLAGPAERARTVVVQVGHGEHLATTSAEGEHTTALSTGECRNLSLA